MLSLDLFTSKFEQSVCTRAVDLVMEQDRPDPQEKIPTNINQFNTDDNRALVKRIWAQISQHAINDTAGWLTLEWPNQPAATLSRNQVWTVINKIAKMPVTQRNAFALSTLGDRNAFLTWMNGLKIIPRPAPKKELPRGQQSLDLKELNQKKSSKESPYKDVRVQRAMRQATADYPAAGSDAEAFAKSMLDAQDQDQENIAKLRQSTQRQRDLLNKNDRLDQRQQQMLGSLEKEINDVEQINTSLEKTVQQMQQANAALQRKLDQMRGKAVVTPTIPVEPGVSVATDKIVQQPTPATPPAIDPRARRYAQALRKQIDQIQTMAALKAPEDQAQLKQDIDALKAQLVKLQQKEPVATATPATVGGQVADIMPARGSADADTDDGVIDLTGVDDVLAQFRQPAKKAAKKKAKKEKEFELAETDTIPLKSVVQGYQIDYDPRTRRVTVSRRGQVVGSGTNRLNSPKYHLTLINRIIDRAEEDKYPTDIDDRDVALPMKKDLNKMRASELQESGPETWTAYFTDGTKIQVRVPNDETDPAKVRAFLARKTGKTVDKFDYGFGTEPSAGPGPEAHEPGSGTAVSAQTGERLPEADTFNRGGHNPLRDINDYQDKRAHLFDLLSNAGMAPEDKQFIRQRLQDLDTAARKQGFVK